MLEDSNKVCVGVYVYLFVALTSSCCLRIGLSVYGSSILRLLDQRFKAVDVLSLYLVVRKSSYSVNSDLVISIFLFFLVPV